MMKIIIALTIFMLSLNSINVFARGQAGGNVQHLPNKTLQQQAMVKSTLIPTNQPKTK